MAAPTGRAQGLKTVLLMIMNGCPRVAATTIRLVTEEPSGGGGSLGHRKPRPLMPKPQFFIRGACTKTIHNQVADSVLPRFALDGRLQGSIS